MESARWYIARAHARERARKTAASLNNSNPSSACSSRKASLSEPAVTLVVAQRGASRAGDEASAAPPPARASTASSFASCTSTSTVFSASQHSEVDTAATSPALGDDEVEAHARRAELEKKFGAMDLRAAVHAAIG